MSDLDHITRVAKLFSSHDSVPCPHCGHHHPISDPDTCQQVVSYWGDNTHDFYCDGCGKDFVVEERVTRQFKTAKTHEDLQNSDD
jgi:predicted RNA-binding Zn-ribbon protein involved in translation (DUF1610 family)